VKVLTRLSLLPLLMLAVCGSAAAQAPGRWGCRMDSLSTFNCAQYYSGTVTMAADLRGTNVNQTRRVVATITGGRVSCRVSGTDVTEFEGPGMLAVEHKATQVAGGAYEISVWCPEEAGGRPTRRDTPLITVMNQQAADYSVLEGRDAHEHPDADAANGLSGSETITWTLRRP
jgi:hypothetical protein